MTRLGKKLMVLANEQTMLVEESTANDVLGAEVAQKVTLKVRPIDATKFRSYVDDVGYITMLLLSLSGRLARTENALHSIGENVVDKVSDFCAAGCFQSGIFIDEIVSRKFWRPNAIACWSNWTKPSF